MTNRRDFLKISGLLASGNLVGFHPPTHSGLARRFSLCTYTATLNSNPEFLDLIIKSGVNDVWMPYFLNGYWAYPMEDILKWKAKFNKKGGQYSDCQCPVRPSRKFVGRFTPKNWRVFLCGAPE